MNHLQSFILKGFATGLTRNAIHRMYRTYERIVHPTNAQLYHREDQSK